MPTADPGSRTVIEPAQLHPTQANYGDTVRERQQYVDLYGYPATDSWSPQLPPPPPPGYVHLAQPGPMYYPVYSGPPAAFHYRRPAPPPPPPPPAPAVTRVRTVPAFLSRSRSTSRSRPRSRYDYRSRYRSSSSSSRTRSPSFRPTTRSAYRSRPRTRSRSPSTESLEGYYEGYPSHVSNRVVERRSVHTRLDAPDSEDDDFGPSVVYSFTPSRASPGGFSREDTGASASREESLEDGAKPEHNSRGGRTPPVASHVFESRYTGDGVFGERHAAQLSVVEDRKVKYQPLFRWFHFTRPVLDFEDFSSKVAQIDNLSGVERKSIAKILSRLKRSGLRPVQLSSGQAAQRMKPMFIWDHLEPDTQYKGIGRRTILWICLPYFSLEPYSGLRTEPGSSSAVPAQALLQSQFPHVTRRREMKQVISRDRNNRQKGLCLHVAQLWCLVLDNSLLITYSGAPDAALCGDFVTKTIAPLDALVGTAEKRKISVYFGGCVMWSIPLDECQTWFALMSHFRDFWPRHLELYHHRRKITAKDWPSIWHSARHINTMIRLDLRLGGPTRPPQNGRLLPDTTLGNGKNDDEEDVQAARTPAKVSPMPPNKSAGTSGPVPPAVLKTTNGAPTETFAVFTCLIGASEPDPESVNSDMVKEHLDEVHEFLQHSTRFSDRKAYSDCKECTRASVRSSLEEEATTLGSVETSDPETTREAQSDYEQRIDIFNAADLVFRFFLPVNFEAPTVEKFWGAVNGIVTHKPTHRHRYRFQQSVSYVRSQLRVLAVNLTPFNDVFSYARGSDFARIHLPNEITQAWMHLILGLVHCTKNSDRTERFLDGATYLLARGTNIIIRSLSQQSLEEKSTVLPLEVFSLISLQLMQGVANVQDVQVRPDSEKSNADVVEVYRNRLDEIEADIDVRASDSVNERNIRLVREELLAVQSTLNTQSELFAGLSRFSHKVSYRDWATAEHENEISKTAPGQIRNKSRWIGADETPTSRFHKPLSQTRTREEPAHTKHADPDMFSYLDVLAGPEVQAAFKLPPTDPGGYRDLLVQECSALTIQREEEVRQLLRRCDELELKNRDEIDTTRLRQEKALYAFTIVTVIFLPLSAVASIFGMNTADIRDLDQGQWIYWATAVPVTVAVMFLGLLWTGELRNFSKWVLRRVARWLFRHRHALRYHAGGDRHKEAALYYSDSGSDSDYSPRARVRYATRRSPRRVQRMRVIY
ncbi:hypothetical protein VTK56DRAFT_7252 [Thermocarpiscus australiensis]